MTTLSQTVPLDMAPEEILPIAILMDELKHEDISFRLAAIKKLNVIALVLGPERCRDELVPFLEDSVDDEDEVLVALAEELSKFVDYIGGPGYAQLLLHTLESLAAAEETVVREKAVESIGKIAALLSPQQIEFSLVPLVKRLSGGEWFTSKTSACGLYVHAYPFAKPEVQEELRKLYANLAHDDTPMVRRAAANNLPAFIEIISIQHLKNEFFTIFFDLAADEQDTVRLLSIPLFIALAKRVEPDEVKQKLLPTLLHLIHDKSWRVRYMAATKYVEITQIVGTQDTDLVQPFVHLLRDTEAEVRTAMTTQIPGFCKLLEPSMVLSTLVPCFQDVVVDLHQHVRSSMAKNLPLIAPILGKQITIDHLLSLYLALLKDEFSEVRLNLISKLEHINDVIGIELLSQSLLPSIVELAEDKQWRVRLAIIDYMPLLAKQVGASFFNMKLWPLCLNWLGDPVFAVREASCNNLKQLTIVFGESWANEHLLNQIVPMASNTNFLFRLTTVMAISTISSLLPEKELRERVVPVLQHLAEDPVPNVRFNVAKCIETVLPYLKNFHIESPLLQLLQKLESDSDTDVRFYAKRAVTVK